MAEKDLNTSFIPRESFSGDGGNDRQQKRTKEDSSSGSGSQRGLLFTISAAILVAIILAAGGVFLYKTHLQSQLEEKRQELQQAQSAFEPDLIADLTRLETRLNSAQGLLDQHTSYTPIFRIMEDTTLASVQYTSLSITPPENTGQQANNQQDSPQGATVSIGGVARDYATVALQSEALSEHESVVNPILSDFNVNENGDVEFAVEFSVAPASVFYENTI